MPSLKTIWENSMIQKHPIWTVIGIFIILLILDFQIITSFFSAWQRSEWLDLVAALLIAITLYLQSISTEKTARMEMAKVLTEAFSHSEMFEAIEYFLQVSPYLVDENGNDRQVYIQEINEKPETKKYRYQILTTLHHAERLYQKEKEAEKVLFTSLITPDIVEVSLCLYKLDDYMKEVDKPVYEMVYKVFEKIRTSYIKPLVKAYSKGTQIDSEKVEHTRRVLTSLQDWDREWGDRGDRIVTKTHLILLDFLKPRNKSYEDLLSQLKRLEKQYEQFTQSSNTIKNKERFIDLFLMLAGTKIRDKDCQGAIEFYDTAIELNPNDYKTYANRGLAKAELGRHTEAIEDFDKVIKHNSNDYMTYVNRGVVKIQLGRHVEAEEDFQKAIELESNNPDVYEKIAEIYDTKSRCADQVKNHRKMYEYLGEAKRLRDLEQ